MLKRQIYGRAAFDLLRKRVLLPTDLKLNHYSRDRTEVQSQESVDLRAGLRLAGFVPMSSRAPVEECRS